MEEKWSEEEEDCIAARLVKGATVKKKGAKKGQKRGIFSPKKGQ